MGWLPHRVSWVRRVLSSYQSPLNWNFDDEMLGKSLIFIRCTLNRLNILLTIVEFDQLKVVMNYREAEIYFCFVIGLFGSILGTSILPIFLVENSSLEMKPLKCDIYKATTNIP